MTRNEFEALLRRNLTDLPAEDRERSVAYFNEMLDERIEAGETEEAAVAAMGDPETIISDILSESSFTKRIRKKLRSGRLRAWEIVLLVLGSPVWLSVLLAAFVVVLAVYVTLWCIVLSCWCGVAALAVGVPASLLCGVLLGLRNPALGIFLFGCAVFFTGLVLLLIPTCTFLTKGVGRLGKKLWKGIGSLFKRKEKKQ